jgi:hypothetical protein
MIDQEVASRVAAYKGNPQALQQKYAASQQLIDLLALQKIKSAQEAAAREMQMQMAQQQAANGESNMTVAQQREKEVMDMTKQELVQQRGALAQQQQQEQQQAMQKLMGGITNAQGAASAMEPKAMAAGGIVAFNGEDNEQEVGSEKKKLRPYPLSEQGADWVARKQAARDADAKKPLDAEAQAALQEAQRTGDRNAMLMTLKKLGAAGYDVATLIPRAFMGVAEDVSNTRLGRALGADFKIPQAAYGGDRASMTPMMDRVNREEKAGIAALTPKPQLPPMRTASEAQATAAAGPQAAVPPSAPAPMAPPQAGPRPPMPAAPRPPVQQGLGGLPTAQMGPPEETVQSALNRQTVSALKTNPQADKLAEEARIEGRLKPTPEQRAVYEEGIAGLRGMYEKDFDPEMQRREGIKRYLLGMGGRSMGEFAGGAETAMNYDATQRNLKRSRFNELQGKREGLIGLDRAAVTGGIEGGFKTYDQASQLLRSGLQAGTDITKTEQTAKDNAAMREIERLKIASTNAANEAQRDSTNLFRMQQESTKILRYRADAINKAITPFARQLDMVNMTLASNPKDANALKERQAIELRMEAAKDAASKPFDLDLARVESLMYGNKGPIAGAKVEKLSK